MGRDTAIVAIEVEQETIPKLSNGATSDDLEWPRRLFAAKRNARTVWTIKFQLLNRNPRARRSAPRLPCCKPRRTLQCDKTVDVA